MNIRAGDLAALTLLTNFELASEMTDIPDYELKNITSLAPPGRFIT